MIPETMQELIIFQILKMETLYNDDFSKYLSENYDLEKMDKRYFKLLDTFLTDYALNKSEKSE